LSFADTSTSFMVNSSNITPLMASHIDVSAQSTPSTSSYSVKEKIIKREYNLIQIIILNF